MAASHPDVVNWQGTGSLSPLSNDDHLLAKLSFWYCDLILTNRLGDAHLPVVATGLRSCEILNGQNRSQDPENQVQNKSSQLENLGAERETITSPIWIWNKSLIHNSKRSYLQNALAWHAAIDANEEIRYCSSSFKLCCHLGLLFVGACVAESKVFDSVVILR
jgi:hypothetical protein